MGMAARPLVLPLRQVVIFVFPFIRFTQFNGQPSTRRQKAPARCQPRTRKVWPPQTARIPRPFSYIRFINRPAHELVSRPAQYSLLLCSQQQAATGKISRAKGALLATNSRPSERPYQDILRLRRRCIPFTDCGPLPRIRPWVGRRVLDDLIVTERRKVSVP